MSHVLAVPVLTRVLCNAVALNVPPSAIVVQNDAKAKVVVLGTVHFSKKSVEEVSEVSYKRNKKWYKTDVKSRCFINVFVLLCISKLRLAIL